MIFPQPYSYEISHYERQLSQPLQLPSPGGMEGVPGADLGILRGGGGSGPEFFKGGLGSRSAGMFIY